MGSQAATRRQSEVGSKAPSRRQSEVGSQAASKRPSEVGNKGPSRRQSEVGGQVASKPASGSQPVAESCEPSPTRPSPRSRPSLDPDLNSGSASQPQRRATSARQGVPTSSPPPQSGWLAEAPGVLLQPPEGAAQGQGQEDLDLDPDPDMDLIAHHGEGVRPRQAWHGAVCEEQEGLPAATATTAATGHPRVQFNLYPEVRSFRFGDLAPALPGQPGHRPQLAWGEPAPASDPDATASACGGVGAAATANGHQGQGGGRGAVAAVAAAVGKVGLWANGHGHGRWGAVAAGGEVAMVSSRFRSMVACEGARVHSHPQPGGM